MSPLTLVIQTNNLGEIIRIYSDVPLSVVKVDSDGKGGPLEQDGPLASMPDKLRGAVERIQNPYRHLTSIQAEEIQTHAVEQLVADCADEGFRRKFVRGIVEDMTVAEALAEVMGDEAEETIAAKLGFDPETGKDVVKVDPVAEELKKPCTLNWGRGRINKVWHVCTTEPRPTYPGSTDKTKKQMFNVDTACGFFDAVIVGLPTPIDCTDQPGFSPGSSSVCPECVKYRLRKAYPENKENA